MFQAVKENQNVSEEISQKSREIEKLKADEQRLKHKHEVNKKKLKEFRGNLKQIERDEDELLQRNNALRGDFMDFDENVKEEADHITEEMRSLFKLLGLKVSLKVAENKLLELKIQFKEDLSYSASFAYDSETEDYDCK